MVTAYTAPARSSRVADVLSSILACSGRLPVRDATDSTMVLLSASKVTVVCDGCAAGVGKRSAEAASNMSTEL